MTKDTIINWRQFWFQISRQLRTVLGKAHKSSARNWSDRESNLDSLHHATMVSHNLNEHFHSKIIMLFVICNFLVCVHRQLNSYYTKLTSLNSQVYSK
jgi:hypothetical protein